MAEEIERVHYYQNEYLGAEDFKAEQAYHRDMRRRHNVGHHRWGIVTGLELVEIAKGNGSGGYDVYVYPGMAVDGFGREIVVLEPYKLDASLFASFGGTSPHSVWLSYREKTDTPPASGYELCDSGDQNKRVHEEFVAVIDPALPTHQAIVIDAKTPPLRTKDTPASQVSIYDDESVPHQDFPEATNARWLVRLGSSTWNATDQRFEQTNADKLIEGRFYTSIVAAEVTTPADTLTMRQRGPTDPTKIDEKPFARIQGQLQVDGRIVAKKNLYMQGGRVSLQGDGGTELNNVALWMKRIDGTGSDLRLHIGPDSGTKSERRLTIGPGTDENNPTQATEKVVLAVKADDTVDIPTGKLSFGAALRQMVNLWNESYGIGIQTGTLYQRSGSDFAWFRGGAHIDAQGNPGAGGVLAMKLDSASKLTVSGSISAPSVQATNVYVDGGSLHLRNATGGEDTDPLRITRHHNGPDQNDLRLVIGDNEGGGDALSVGPVVNDTDFREKFRVFNNGNVTMTGSLTLETGRFVNIGTMRLGGTWPVDVVVVRVVLNATNSSGVIGPFYVPSRMPTVSAVTAVGALSDISNDHTAIDAGWGIQPINVVPAFGNMARYDISYRVTDSDGHLGAVSFIFVMVP